MDSLIFDDCDADMGEYLAPYGKGWTKCRDLEKGLIKSKHCLSMAPTTIWELEKEEINTSRKNDRSKEDKLWKDNEYLSRLKADKVEESGPNTKTFESLNGNDRSNSHG